MQFSRETQGENKKHKKIPLLSFANSKKFTHRNNTNAKLEEKNIYFGDTGNRIKRPLLNLSRLILPTRNLTIFFLGFNPVFSNFVFLKEMNNLELHITFPIADSKLAPLCAHYLLKCGVKQG